MSASFKIWLSVYDNRLFFQDWILHLRLGRCICTLLFAPSEHKIPILPRSCFENAEVACCDTPPSFSDIAFVMCPATALIHYGLQPFIPRVTVQASHAAPLLRLLWRNPVDRCVLVRGCSWWQPMRCRRKNGTYSVSHSNGVAWRAMNDRWLSLMCRS